MIYGFQDGKTLYIVAGDDKAEFDIFMMSASDLIGGREAASLDFLVNPLLAKFRNSHIIECDSGMVAAALVEQHEFVILTHPKALDRQNAMFDKELIDPYSAEAQAQDFRTIEEIFGLDKNDPWDKRTPEEIEQDEQNRKLGEQAQKEGRLSGDSFSATRKKRAQLTDVKLSRDADGNITVDSALGVKGLWDDPQAPDLSNPGSLTKPSPSQGTSAAPTAIERDPNEPTKRPWDIGSGDSTPFSLKNIKPDEFVFAINALDIFNTGALTTMAVITPKTFWWIHKTIYSHQIQYFINEAVPGIEDLLDELSIAVFAVNGLNKEEARATLLHAGFVEEDAFVTFLNEESKRGGGKDEAMFVDVTVPADMSKARDITPPPPIEPELLDGVAQVFVDKVDAEDVATVTVGDLSVIDGLLIALVRGDTAEIKPVDANSFTTANILLAAQLAICLERRKISCSITFRGSVLDHRSLIQASQGIEGFPFDIFFRIDFPGMGIDEVVTELKNVGENPDKLLVRRGELPMGAWGFCGIERLAHKVENIIKAARPDVDTELYGVGQDGDRLVPKGMAQVIQPNQPREIGPRPWNAEAKKFKKFKKAEREVEIKNIKGDEFWFSGSYERAGKCHVYIVPKSYFAETGELYPEPLNIGNLLPDDLELQSDDGHYISKGRDWNSMTYEMARRGFEESVKLRLYLNSF